MRIQYISSVRIPNEKASGLAIVKQCDAFAHLGHQVTLYVPYRDNPIKESLFEYHCVERTFDVVHMPGFEAMRPVAGFKLYKVGFVLNRVSQMILGAFLPQTDLVYTRDPYMALAHVLMGKRVALELHTAYKGFLAKWVARHVKNLIVISHGLKEYYWRADAIVAPSGCDLRQFEHVPTQSECRELLGLPQDKTLFAYVGRGKTMGESKGVQEIMEAFESIQSDRVHLLIVQDVEQNKAVYQISENVTILPLNEKLFAQYLTAADILVMNYPDKQHYRHYMSPSKLFAYMGAGKQIVSSDLPSIREILPREQDGIHYAQPDDIYSLISAMYRALNAPKDAPELKKYAQWYTWDRRAHHILSKIVNNITT